MSLIVISAYVSSVNNYSQSTGFLNNSVVNVICDVSLCTSLMTHLTSLTTKSPGVFDMKQVKLI